MPSQKFTYRLTSKFAKMLGKLKHFKQMNDNLHGSLMSYVHNLNYYQFIELDDSTTSL